MNVCMHRGILVHRPCMIMHACVCVCVCVCGYRCAHGPGRHYLCLCNSGGPCTCVCMVSCVDVGLSQGMSVRVPLGAQAQHILKCSDMLPSLDLGVRAHVSLGAHIWHLCRGWTCCFPSHQPPGLSYRASPLQLVLLVMAQPPPRPQGENPGNFIIIPKVPDSELSLSAVSSGPGWCL